MQCPDNLDAYDQFEAEQDRMRRRIEKQYIEEQQADDTYTEKEGKNA